MELTIDTASPLASIAVTEEGRLVAEATWLTRSGHAAELLPAIERLLAASGTSRDEIRAIFVDRGPGGYAGLRVGISTALALALALDGEVLGYGRLEADAFPFLRAGRPVCAVHDAGRGEHAWAVYEAEGALPRELSAPRISGPDELVEALTAEMLIVGEVSVALAERLPEGAAASTVTGAAAVRHASAAAGLAWSRYAAGARDSRLALTPLYLREPNITTRRRDPRETPTGG